MSGAPWKSCAWREESPAAEGEALAAGDRAGEQDRVTFVREARGVPAWLVRADLEELGGVVVGDAVTGGAAASDCAVDAMIDGDGWAAQVQQIEDYQIGSIIVGQVRIVLTGGRSMLERIQVGLERKLLRGGG